MMARDFNPIKNYKKTMEQVGWVSRKEATQETYDRIGFMSGLEVHQQILTEKKLFCNCPAGLFHDHNDYDAEVIRHMRPTLSELGEYDGTALMEFKTRKNITYRCKHETTCTYEIDDTPPFPINKDALEKAISISLLSKLNIVGEVHITRKQYLDGSIPAGFQRTAIIGVSGEIPLKHKKIGLIQLSIEEDSCREISDIRHERVYKTDRLGMPLIETVTEPECVNPDEVKEACDYIRFLNRSTGLVRTGMGAGRQDVNVSCKGGSRVEIKGVAHTKWIPELTHVECFRQWGLLQIRDILNKRVSDIKNWKVKAERLDWDAYEVTYGALKVAKDDNWQLWGVNLPHFKGILSHFTQPSKMFADEICDRLKVVACLEKPNIVHSEMFDSIITEMDFNILLPMLNANEDDAQILFWAPEEDVKTALETIEERCQMALEGVPEETRKSFEDGSTIFERVLPGADRMYPDTDSPPIPLEDEYIEDLRSKLPSDVIERYHQLVKWNIPEDTHTYIFSKNYFPVIKKIIEELKIDSKFIGTFFGHRFKYIEGHYQASTEFKPEQIFTLFQYLKEKKYDFRIATKMLTEMYQHPKMDFESILTSINFKKTSEKEIVSKIKFLKERFDKERRSSEEKAEKDWIMGQLHHLALGNLSLSELSKQI
jgi:glutamyl-tRNA(Gln) amidotransferase subunit E